MVLYKVTGAGFWKATGRDKAVLSKERIIGMRKTLLFYRGRAPNGRKTDWIIHEYRNQTAEHGPPQEEGWVVCRAFTKPNPSNKPGFEAWNNAYYLGDRRNYRLPSYPTTPAMIPCFDPSGLNQGTSLQLLSIPPETLKATLGPFESQMVDLPNLDSPSISASLATDDTNFKHNIVANEELEDEKSYFSNQ